MKSLFEQLGIAFFGLLTTLLVVLVDVASGRMGLQLSGISVNLIPVGAIGAGAVAASGYYFGAVYTHNRANASLLVFMVIVAALAEILIYWFEYISLVVNGTHARDLISFSNFIQLAVEHTQVKIFGRGVGYRNIGEVGWFSYVLALRRFIGFLIGGIVVYFILRSKSVCPSCNLYLDKLGLGQHVFPNAETAVDHLERFKRDAMDGSSLVSLIGVPATPEKVEKGSFRVTSSLFGCPICARRVVVHELAVYAKDEWKDLSDHTVSMEFEPADDRRSSTAVRPVGEVHER